MQPLRSILSSYSGAYLSFPTCNTFTQGERSYGVRFLLPIGNFQFQPNDSELYSYLESLSTTGECIMYGNWKSSPNGISRQGWLCYTVTIVEFIDDTSIDTD